MTSNYYMTIISNYVRTHIDIFLIAVMIVSVLTLIAFIIINIKLSKIARKYKELTKGVDGGNLEELILQQMESLKDTQSHISDLSQEVIKLENESHIAIKKVHSKRYNAFPEVGSDLSFSLVMLNYENTGVVMTSIYGRDENRIYLKPIAKGKCDYVLSPEEQEIVSTAISE
ncbi:MAG: DUF4446 family protein [Tepidanaerobacteraceae bacterium]